LTGPTSPAPIASCPIPLTPTLALSSTRSERSPRITSQPATFISPSARINFNTRQPLSSHPPLTTKGTRASALEQLRLLGPCRRPQGPPHAAASDPRRQPLPEAVEAPSFETTLAASQRQTAEAAALAGVKTLSSRQLTALDRAQPQSAPHAAARPLDDLPQGGLSGADGDVPLTVHSELRAQQGQPHGRTQFAGGGALFSRCERFAKRTGFSQRIEEFTLGEVKDL
jgi:hypothetical protein